MAVWASSHQGPLQREDITIYLVALDFCSNCSGHNEDPFYFQIKQNFWLSSILYLNFSFFNKTNEGYALP